MKTIFDKLVHISEESILMVARIIIEFLCSAIRTILGVKKLKKENQELRGVVVAKDSQLTHAGKTILRYEQIGVIGVLVLLILGIAFLGKVSK